MGNKCWVDAPDEDGYGMLKSSSHTLERIPTYSSFKHVKFEDEEGIEHQDLPRHALEFVPSNIDKFEYFAPFDDSKKLLCSVNSSVKILETITGKLLNELLHPQAVNKWFSFWGDQKVLTWCQDGVVRVFYAFEDDITEQLAAQLIGHRLSCTSGCFSPDEKSLVTSGRDQETILWDIEAQRKISNLRIEGNYTTDMVWIPDSESLFLQTGEDCKLRIFDTRTQLKAVHSYKIGDSFALSFDIDNSGNYLTTGHRGFNGKGWYVKLWDMRTITTNKLLPVFEYEHEKAVISNRFYYLPGKNSATKYIISASLDHTLKLTELTGEMKFSFKSDECFTSMSPLRKRANAERIGVATDELIVAATIKPQLFLYSVDPVTLEIVEYKWSYTKP